MDLLIIVLLVIVFARGGSKGWEGRYLKLLNFIKINFLLISLGWTEY